MFCFPLIHAWHYHSSVANNSSSNRIWYRSFIITYKNWCAFFSSCPWIFEYSVVLTVWFYFLSIIVHFLSLSSNARWLFLIFAFCVSVDYISDISQYTQKKSTRRNRKKIYWHQTKRLIYMDIENLMWMLNKHCSRKKKREQNEGKKYNNYDAWNEVALQQRIGKRQKSYLALYQYWPHTERHIAGLEQRGRESNIMKCFVLHTNTRNHCEKRPKLPSSHTHTHTKQYDIELIFASHFKLVEMFFFSICDHISCHAFGIECVFKFKNDFFGAEMNEWMEVSIVKRLTKCYFHCCYSRPIFW